MATTPFVDLKSEDILSAHISGLQHAINKIETVLNENETAIIGHTLVAVTDQADINLHNLIYEGTVRNWLSNPAPVIKRNGTVVATSEYTIEPAYGVVVFYAQQNPSDVITADVTYVSGGSQAIDGMNQSISDNATNISANASAIATLQNLNLLKKRFNLGIVGQYEGHNSNGGSFATNVNAGGNNLDAFPFVVTETTTFDKMMVEISSTAATQTKMLMGVYSDAGNYPGDLVASTIELTDFTAGVKEIAFANGDLTLQPGLYWIARWQDGSTSLNRGLNSYSAISIGVIPDATNLDTVGSGPVGGVRVNIVYNSALPTTFWSLSAGAKWLFRTTYASPWIKKKA